MIPSKILRGITALALSLTTVISGTASAEEEQISVEYIPDSGKAVVFVPGSGGEVALADIARGLSRARGYDDSALMGVLPDQSIPVDNTVAQLALFAINRSLDDAMSLSTKDGGLQITLDDQAILASRARFRKLILKGFTKVFSDGPDPEDFGLDLPKDWDKTPEEKPLYVLVHGLNSDAGFMADWQKILDERGHLTASYTYPNDQAVTESAELLSEELEELIEDSPDRKVKLLTHSMGGLVARAMLENPDLDQENVDQLVMLAPPSQGSQLANFSFGLEIWELLGLRGESASWAERFYRAVEDGLCTAAENLKPGSAFLTELNARLRNPRVRYTIFAGDVSPLPEGSNKLLIRALAEAPDTSRFKRFFGPKLNPILEDMHEISNETGDGLVSVERAKLDGVDDFVVMPFRHDTVLTPDKIEGLEEAVLKRLEE